MPDSESVQFQPAWPGSLDPRRSIRVSPGTTSKTFCLLGASREGEALWMTREETERVTRALCANLNWPCPKERDPKLLRLAKQFPIGTLVNREGWSGKVIAVNRARGVDSEDGIYVDHCGVYYVLADQGGVAMGWYADKVEIVDEVEERLSALDKQFPVGTKVRVSGRSGVHTVAAATSNAAAWGRTKVGSAYAGPRQDYVCVETRFQISGWKPSALTVDEVGEKLAALDAKFPVGTRVRNGNGMVGTVVDAFTYRDYNTGTRRYRGAFNVTYCGDMQFIAVLWDSNVTGSGSPSDLTILSEREERMVSLAKEYPYGTRVRWGNRTGTVAAFPTDHRLSMERLSDPAFEDAILSNGLSDGTHYYVSTLFDTGGWDCPNVDTVVTL